MLLHFDNKGCLIDSKLNDYRKVKKSKEELWIKCDVLCRFDNNLDVYKYNNDMLYDDLSKCRHAKDVMPYVAGGYVLISISNNKLNYIGTDLSAIERVYCFEINNERIYFDNLDEFKQMYPDIRFEKDESKYNYFLSHGYVRGEKTIVKNLTKLQPGILYYGDNSEIDLLDLYNIECVCDYSKYKKTLHSLIEMASCNKKTYVMHSGGIDSNLMMAIAKECSDELELITYQYKKPYEMDTNIADVKRSERISKLFGLKHEVVMSSFENYEKKLNESGILGIMPMESHKTSGAVIDLFSYIKNNNKKEDEKYIVLCGQNNDTLYNFGPTELPTGNIFKIKNFKRGLQGICQRLLIDQKYVKSLEGKRIYKKFVDVLVKTVFSLRYKKKYIAPQNINELINYFLNSECYFAMRESSQSFEIKKYNNINAANFRNVLFKEKLRSFMDGNDSKIIINAAKLESVKVVMPYSLQPMILFYYKRADLKKDVLNPKKYCYDYGKELGLTRKMFATEYEKKIIKGRQWDDLLKRTFSTNKEGFNFQQVIGEFWTQNIFK